MRLKGRRTEIGEHPVSIRLLDEDEKEIISGNGTVTFAEPPAGVVDIEAGSVLVFDVPLEKPGRYRFEITVDESITANVPLTVGTAPEEKRKQES